MGTHYRGSAPEVRALDAFIVLFRAADTVARLTTRRAADHGLTGAQFGILETLLHLGPLDHSTLARKLLVSGGNVTFLVKRLERAGLVEQNCPGPDRRCRLVQLTPQGRQRITAAFAGVLEHIVRVMGALTPEEQTELARLCRKLGLSNIAQSKPEKNDENNPIRSDDDARHDRRRRRRRMGG